MGQQQILFLILGICVIGIAVSAGAIAFQSDGGIDQRQLLYDEMNKLALRAQAFRSSPLEQNGGDGTFFGLTATPHGIARLMPTSTTPFGEFHISRSGNRHSVEMTVIGTHPGNDPRKPIKLIMNVWRDKSSITSLN